MWTPVARLSELQNGRLVVKRPEHKKLILLLYTGEEVFALEDICTHDGGPLHEGDV
ncbi:Rieske (2Fe-2S) protein, partial [Thermus scotoductus]|uniref:Rieske (2Fe-2S) protein n=1 Tax=Thermus scotoductus TaxID=37636 RepID=UPI0010024282